MVDKDSNTHRKEEGEVSKGLPEAAPEGGNAYEEDDTLSHDDHRKAQREQDQ